ncbi:hypothetical protein BGX27_007176 [Mortierella sp. AM989]|nr:hypothetical protein BGX27_007176 [Mortierella sp. AM989]
MANSYISVHDLSADCLYLWTSPSVYDVMGYTSEEMVGMSLAKIVHPDDLLSAVQAVKENIQNDFVATQCINRHMHKDGRPEFDRIRRHHKAFSTNSWDPRALDTENRVFFILNRFTRGLIVMYASSACKSVLHLDPDDIEGKPILLFVRSDALGMFVEQVDLVKAQDTIVSMKFWFQSPNWPCEIPCESVFVASSDGILAVMRVCKPFVRHHFLGYSNLSDSEAVNSSYSTSSTLTSNPSPRTPPDSHLWCPPYVPRSKLNQIKIFELGDDDDDDIRPVVVSEDDPTLIKDSEIASIVPGFKAFIINDDDKDDGES